MESYYTVAAPIYAFKYSDTCFSRPVMDGTTSTVFVFGKGMLDLIDYVFWMLPFNSDRQAKRVRTDNNITDNVWNARRKFIMEDHRLPTARAELAQYWKQRLINKGGQPAPSAAAPGSAPASVVDPEAIQYDETDE